MLSNAGTAAASSFASAARQQHLPSRITLVIRRSSTNRVMHRFQDLEEAIKLGDSQKAVQILATSQANSVELVSAVDASGASALHAAAARGLTQVVEQLLSRGALPRAQDQRWDQPLHAAGENARSSVHFLHMKCSSALRLCPVGVPKHM
jgi:ankyrin repeat protein